MNKELKQAAKGRVEGVAKVTGKATYSAEYALEGMLHGVFVGSTITKGKITALHTEDALAIPGVVEVFSVFNPPPIAGFATPEKAKEIWVSHPVFYTDEIQYNDQYIALVIAETLEDATYAASLIGAEYEEDKNFTVNFDAEFEQAKANLSGDVRGSEENWNNAQRVVDEEYTIAMEVHNPMEMHATIAHWNGSDELTLYDKNQGVNNVQSILAKVFELPTDNIRVISEFVGGGFGSGLRVWPHTIAAAAAAKQLNRAVKVVLTRPQMFTQVGFRPESWQRIKLSADENGQFLGAIHQGIHSSAAISGFREGITRVSKKIYGFENLTTEEAQITLNIPVPTWMRGPGDSTGCWAMESAIDELCYQYGFDPVEVRLKNIAPYEMETGNPWSSHFLPECIEKGAEIIGWNNRPKEPNTLQKGDWKIGYGHAVGLWNARRNQASASIELREDGKVVVSCAMTDIGTGTGEGMLNITHNQTGIPKNRLIIQLGDSELPPAPSQGGSTGLATLSGAISAAAESFKRKVAAIAFNVPEHEISINAVQFTRTGISMANRATEISYNEILERSGGDIKVQETSVPGDVFKQYGFVSSAAHFCKVRVHELTGRVKVDQFVSVVDGGKIINEQAAANQIIGAVVGGIGMAFLEEQHFDSATGRMLANDLAGYHMPVNASAPIVEVEFINKPDPNINASGAKGIGEVGIIGNAPALANAVFNATGKRYRSLPMTPDKLLTYKS